jgi:hypothetical protein
MDRLMWMIPPEVAFDSHKFRHRELVEAAAKAQLARAATSATPAGPTPGAGGFRQRVRKFGSRIRVTDQKVARLPESWLTPNRRAAISLARLADEIEVPAGTELVAGRFGYVGLERREIVVAPGTPPVTLATDARVLVISACDFPEASRLSGALASAWANATSTTRTTAAPQASATPNQRDGARLRATRHAPARRTGSTLIAPTQYATSSRPSSAALVPSIKSRGQGTTS